jgi:Protein of unknown function (DUF1592)/Protein of unknown function (DUF1588)/Protein of unknown function (DUF1587)/Protein of unknown function (DUF1585)/Protein of unknown function (DUF1595)/Cytochrome C oxidase, cbb3-type, subunit III
MQPARWLYGLLVVPLLCLTGTRSAAQAPASSTFDNTVQPLFSKHCAGCHNAARQTGGLNLEPLNSAAGVLQNRETFEKIVRRLKAGEMPPKGSPRPDEADVRSATSWIESEFDRADLSSEPPVRVLARRLNRTEYNNTVRDLLGIRSRPADEFPPDDSALGFDNIAQALSISPSLMEKYLAAAERVAREAVFGPRPKKNEVAIFNPPVPRRMEYTNRLRVEPPPYYSMFDYDETGLSQPGALHLTYEFPVDGEYLIRVVGANFRPNASEPGQMDLWVDGTLVRSFPINDAEQSGFERRPDHWDIPLKISAGSHQLIVAFPKQFDGLPTIFKGPNPSKIPYDPCRSYGGGRGRCVDELLKQPPDSDPLREARRLENIERAKTEQANPRPFEGFAVHELDIFWPNNYEQRPSVETLQKIFTCGGPSAPYDSRCERSILSNLATRAYRRRATAQDVDELQAIASGARLRGGSFAEGISVAIAAMLASPNFLFRIDRPADARNATAQYDLASRLSYFLWSSMPDEELMRAAERGTLGHREVLDAQVRRMIADPKSQAFVENFAGQWLEIRRLESQQPDRERYPDFDEYLRASMKKETELFFQHVMQEDRSIVDFIEGSYSFLNERLARHYGIRGVTGTAFRKIDLTSAARAGILTHASVLTVSSYGNRTSPVLRGKWILENILNAAPPPPPADVPSLDEDAVGSVASLRQQLEEHRKNPTCASCHARMDPLGFGLENYDAVGAWRTQDGKFAIDSSGTLPDGRNFQGASGLVTILKQNKDAFAENMTEKVLTYALGRGLERHDRPVVRQIVKRMASTDYRFSSLISEIVNSAPFLMQSGRPQP